MNYFKAFFFYHAYAWLPSKIIVMIALWVRGGRRRFAYYDEQTPSQRVHLDLCSKLLQNENFTEVVKEKFKRKNIADLLAEI